MIVQIANMRTQATAMATQKLYAGVKLREIRSRLNLPQNAFAEKLGVSLPNLNQMENNHLMDTYDIVRHT